MYPVLLDPKPLLEEAFSSLATDAGDANKVTWQVDLAEQLPIIETHAYLSHQLNCTIT